MSDVISLPTKTDRADAIAEVLIDSMAAMSDAMTLKEMDDTELMGLVWERVDECNSCGWWVDPTECDENGECEECQMENDDNGDAADGY